MANGYDCGETFDDTNAVRIGHAICSLRMTKKERELFERRELHFHFQVQKRKVRMKKSKR